MDYQIPRHLYEGLNVITADPPFADKILLPYTHAEHKKGTFGSIHTQIARRQDFSIHLHIFQITTPIRLILDAYEPVAALTYIMRGKATYILNACEDTTVEQGHYFMLYIPQGTHALQLEEGDCAIVQIELSSNLLQKMTASHYLTFYVYDSIIEKNPEGIIFYASWVNNRVWDALHRMLYSSLEDDELYLFQDARVLELLLLFVQHTPNIEKKSTHGFRFSPEDIAAVKAAGELKMQNTADTFSLNEIARKFHLHPKKLREGFKEVYGQTSTKLTIEARMEKAKELLKETAKSIEEIAFETGYCNASSFIRTFKRHMNITPAQYRK